MELNHHFFENKQVSLTNEYLKVDISLPGSLYRGSRFDWTGFITQITLDGTHTFCTPEPEQKNTNTNGIGLCNEFSNFIPLENDPASGIPFPKLGIGVLKSSAKEPFSCFKAYDIDPFQVEVIQDSHSIKFITQPAECRGISAYVEKTVTLHEKTITIDYYMKNTGTASIITREYNHNFILIDDCPIGPDYVITLPYEASIESMPEYVSCSGNEIHINESPIDSFHLHPTIDKKMAHKWDLYCKPLKLGIQEENNFCAVHFMIWGRNNVISPEVFVDINLEPNQSMNWSRKYSLYQS